MGRFKTSLQASKIESLKLCPLTHSLAHLLTVVKCRATSVAKRGLVQAGFEKKGTCMGRVLMRKKALVWAGFEEEKKALVWAGFEKRHLYGRALKKGTFMGMF